MKTTISRSAPPPYGADAITAAVASGLRAASLSTIARYSPAQIAALPGTMGTAPATSSAPAAVGEDPYTADRS